MGQDGAELSCPGSSVVANQGDGTAGEKEVDWIFFTGPED